MNNQDNQCVKEGYLCSNCQDMECCESSEDSGKQNKKDIFIYTMITIIAIVALIATTGIVYTLTFVAILIGWAILLVGILALADYLFS